MSVSSISGKIAAHPLTAGQTKPVLPKKDPTKSAADLTPSNGLKDPTLSAADLAATASETAPSTVDITV